MIKPAGSLLQTVQPVALAAMNTTALVRQCSSSNRKWSTWVPTVATCYVVTTVQSSAATMESPWLASTSLTQDTPLPKQLT